MNSQPISRLKRSSPSCALISAAHFSSLPGCSLQCALYALNPLTPTSVVLPIWLAQLLAVVAFGFFSLKVEIPAFAWLFAALVSAALLIQLAKEQLAQRQLAQAIQWVIIVAAIAVWAAPQLSSIFNLLLIVWGLIVCLIYAIFAGWIMKISHLRKSMGFSNELFYNFWRIAVRLVLPLSIVIAIVAVIGQWI
jgi:hypothetical protein